MYCINVSGQSCLHIVMKAPGCRGQSGVFWIENATALPVEVYCDMETQGGGWERVATFEASATTECPSENLMPEILQNGVAVCSNNGSIVDIHFTSTAIFSELKGAVSAYANEAALDGFYPHQSSTLSYDIDGHFMDGVAVMLDDHSGYPKFVYGYGVSHYSNTSPTSDASCNSYSASDPNTIIGPHYKCAVVQEANTAYTLEPLPFSDLNDELCEVLPRTCADPSASFYRQLGTDYTPSDADVVLKVLSEPPSTILLKSYSIYVR